MAVSSSTWGEGQLGEGQLGEGLVQVTGLVGAVGTPTKTHGAPSPCMSFPP